MNNTLTLNNIFTLRKASVLKWSVVFRFFITFGILLIISLLSYCIFQLNTEIAEKYAVQEQESRLVEVSKENTELEMNSVQVNSLNSIVVLTEQLNLEKADKIDYIRVLDNQVVKK